MICLDGSSMLSGSTGLKLTHAAAHGHADGKPGPLCYALTSPFHPCPINLLPPVCSTHALACRCLLALLTLGTALVAAPPCAQQQIAAVVTGSREPVRTQALHSRTLQHLTPASQRPACAAARRPRGSPSCRVHQSRPFPRSCSWAAGRPRWAPATAGRRPATAGRTAAPALRAGTGIRGVV